MAKYQHILFDLDHTLWDFETNSAEAIRDLFPQFGLNLYEGFDEARFIKIYKKVNHDMWRDYHRGIIEKAELRNLRFIKTFEELGLRDEALALEFNDAFITLCPQKSHLLPFAIEVLDYLSNQYELHILTNGFKESQFIKLENSGIQKYFANVFNSETAGCLKPDKRFFDYALNHLDTSSASCMMIGDDLEADVLGAKNAGIDHVFYNRAGVKHGETITYEIKCLSELRNIL